MITECPYCGYTKISEDADVCPRCGLPLSAQFQGTTRILNQNEDEVGTPRWGTAGFTARTDLVLKVQNDDASFIFDADQITELTIGRIDPDTGEAPVVDLNDCNAIDKGVSRRHAKIIRRDGGTLNLVDQESDNGTFLNGQRLVANQPRILRDGDEIRLGYLVLLVHFVKS